MHGSDRPRVLFVTYYWHPYRSGLTLHVSRIAEALAGSPADVEVLAAHHDRSLPARERIAGVDVRRLRVLGHFDRAPLVPGLIPAAVRRLAAVDLLVLATPLAEAAALAAAARLARRRLAVIHICDPQVPGALGARVAMLAGDLSARAAVALAHEVVASSADYAERSRILRSARIPVSAIPPPIELDAFGRDGGGGAGDVGAGDRPAGSELRVGFLGRLTHEKGLDRLLRAVHRLDRPVRVVLAGAGEGVAGGGEAAKLRRLAGELGLSVEFPGPLPDADLPGFYRSLDVFVLPSVSSLEAWGMVQVEAMLCGTPVVASALPGVRDVLGRAGMGIAVTPDDPAELAEAIRTVADRRGDFIRPRDEVIRALGLDTAVERNVRVLRDLATRPR